MTSEFERLFPRNGCPFWGRTWADTMAYIFANLVFSQWDKIFKNRVTTVGSGSARMTHAR
jgi:hypothetical protein